MKRITTLLFLLAAFYGHSQCALVITPSVTDESCPATCDGRIKLTVSGGTTPYTYVWSTAETTATIKNLCPGTYTCFVADLAGCRDTVSYTINPSNYSAGIQKNNLTCFGVCDGSITASPSGGTPSYTYVWTPGGGTTNAITNLCAGTYTVTITDSKNCVLTKVNVVTEPLQLTGTVSGTNASCGTCNDGSADASFSGGNKPYSYNWTPGNYQSAKVTGLGIGTYTVCVTDKNGCTLCKTVTIGTNATGIETRFTGVNITLYPNPAKDHLIFLKDLSAQASVTVLSCLGKSVYTTTLDKSQSKLVIPMDKLPAGIYFVQVVMEGELIVKKVIKQ